MAPSLDENRKAFVKLMTKSDEHARHGFTKLLERSDALDFFDELLAAGLFEPHHNPGPISSDEPGVVRIPYWAAVDYLVAAARHAREHNDVQLANKVLEIVRKTTEFRDSAGGHIDNYRTFYKFAEILGQLPPVVVSLEDTDMTQVWLSSRFDRGLVAHALHDGALKVWTDSDERQDWSKAVRVLRHCLRVQWERRAGADAEDPVPLVEPYLINEIVERYAAKLGRQAGEATTAAFRDAVRDVFSKGGRSMWSYVFRPAVEDHAQNHDWYGIENAVVAGCRDAALEWSSLEGVAEPVRAFARELLDSDIEMLRRIGIFLLAERWDRLRDLYSDELASRVCAWGMLHEVFWLFKKRFAQFTESQKLATLEAIRNVEVPESDDAERLRRLAQLHWLAAIDDVEVPPAVKWVANVRSDPSLSIPRHPDFNSYIEVTTGFGQSPYTPAELVSFCDKGILLDKIAAFNPPRTFDGPTLEGLFEALRQAVQSSPDTFIRGLPRLVDAPFVVQSVILNAFRNVVSGSTATADASWELLVQFSEAFVGKATLAAELNDKGSGAIATLAAIAELIELGTRNDASAYKTTLLPRTWVVLQRLRALAPPAEIPAKDPMAHAINSPKGKVIEAIVSHALRECRVADRASSTHESVWNEKKAVFDDELKKCDSGNYEFSTLLASYLPQFQYMDANWCSDNVPRIFPVQRPENFRCAIAGLAYAPASTWIYRLLQEHDLLLPALNIDYPKEETREKFVERIAVAYLRGEESLEGAVMNVMFTADRISDVEVMASFFWMVRGDGLESEQLGRVVAFWDKCSELAATLHVGTVAKLQGKLGHLAWALPNANGRNRELLVAAAPYIAKQHTTYEFLTQLSRLSDESAEGVVVVLEAMARAHQSFYDYKDELKSLLRKLFAAGLRAPVLQLCGVYRDVPGIPALFRELSASP